MPELVNLVSPQIYIQEVDQTVYNQETSGPVGAIILRNTWKGREKDTVLVTNENDLITKFGQPTSFAPCYYDMFSAIGFLKDANRLYCTRVMPDTATFAGTKATIGTSATFTPFTSANAYGLGTGGGEISDPDLFADEVAVPDPFVMYIIAASRGYSGNYVRVAVCDKAHYNLIRNKTITGWDTYAAIFSVDSPLESDKEFLVIVQECKQGTDPSVESNWEFAEAWNVSTQQNKMDDIGQAMFVDDKINDNSKYIRVCMNASYYNTDLTNFATNDWQVLGGGCNTKTGGLSNDADEVPATAELDSAIDLYANSEDNRVNVFIDGGKEAPQKLKMAEVVNARKDCMLVLDCPSANVVSNQGSESTDLVTWITGLYNSNSAFDSSYIAAYGNWLDVRDKYANRYRWIPASGYVAGVYARCQQNYEPWFAPAGLNRSELTGIRRLAFNPSLAQRNDMYKYAVNPIISFSGQGKFIWGQKTLLDKSSAFNKINVRQLFLTIEREVGDVAKFYIFEANTTIKRTQFINEVAPILERAKGKEGLEDYRILCDTTNNTPTSIAKGELRCDIWVKPVYAIEFIRLTFIASKTGVSFEEG